jgi:hypothetical protein
VTPGIYDGVLASDYHADEVLGEFNGPMPPPSLSASTINTLLTMSPAHARAGHPRLNPNYERKTEEKFDVGTVCHSLLLEGESAVEIVDAPDWRTKWAQESRQVARDHGRIPLLGHHYDSVKGMVAAVTEQIAQLDVDPLPLTAGKPEQTMVWEEQGVLCRARIDWLHDDLAAIDDLKTTSRSANPEAWTRTMFGIGCDVQAAFYLRGLQKVTGRSDIQWRWLVVETQPPYALSVVSPGPAVLELANMKIDAALATWKECLATDTWPAYPKQVCWAELPAWEEARWLAREEVA